MSSGSEPVFDAEVYDDRVALSGPRFGVEFRRLGDRWTESILPAGLSIGLVRSQHVNPRGEGAGRVMHPVYQEVQLHGSERGSTVCLLMTGLSFSHHFSAAVSLSRDADDGSGVLLDFDVADRCRTPVESLAATYLVDLDSGALEAADSRTIVWRLASPVSSRLELVAGPGSALALAEAGRKATRVQIFAAIQPGTFTHRLRYGWRWTSVEGVRP